MFDIWASTAELQQPCLHRPIRDRLKGNDGLVRREILASLDRLFTEHLSAGRTSFRAPPPPRPIPAAQRFLNISALQKSIRRGDADGAMRFAQQGCALNAEQVFRRLAVCAVEDVGLGNLSAVAMALAVLATKDLRQRGAPDQLAAYIAHILASSVKSRLACDLLSIADFERSLDPLKQRLATATPGDLRKAAELKASPYAERMVAAWMLAGTSRFGGAAMPITRGPRSEVMRMMAFARMPLLLYYVADRAASRTSDALFVSIYFVAEMVGSEAQMTVQQSPATDTAQVAGFPAAAFDAHTHEGRAALSKFARTELMKEPLLGVPARLRDTAVRHAAFIAEGGYLSKQLRFDDADRIERQAHRAELSFAGLSKETAQASLVTTVIAHLPLLHAIRQEVSERWLARA